jgi:hypothetical protein
MITTTEAAAMIMEEVMMEVAESKHIPADQRIESGPWSVLRIRSFV